eukprot:6334576-Prorocentrum_lima.AAC.1
METVVPPDGEPPIECLSYLDDLTVVCPPGLANTVAEQLPVILHSAGLVVNMAKTQLWSPAGSTGEGPAIS